MNKSELVELKYLSRDEGDINVASLAEIVDVSMVSNEMNGITGILFFDHGYFGQILEGPRKAIEETWVRIKGDARHHDIELLGIKRIPERRFPTWSMKLFDAKDFAAAFPRFVEIVARMHDPDAENIRILKSLWRDF